MTETIFIILYLVEIIAIMWLLWGVGLMMQVFAYDIALMLPTGYDEEAMELAGQISVHLLGSFFEMFFMTAVVIGLIMYGNRQSLYHRKVTGMQSGMITLMADIVENRDDNTGEHIKRTAKYVECIAKELKRRDTYKDILTDEEFAIIKLYTTAGKDLLIRAKEELGEYGYLTMAADDLVVQE